MTSAKEEVLAYSRQQCLKVLEHSWVCRTIGPQGACNSPASLPNLTQGWPTMGSQGWWVCEQELLPNSILHLLPFCTYICADDQLPAICEPWESLPLGSYL